MFMDGLMSLTETFSFVPLESPNGLKNFRYFKLEGNLINSFLYVESR
jgi:hypothetical protein